MIAHLLMLLYLILQAGCVYAFSERLCTLCWETGSLFGAWGSPATLGWPENSALPTLRLQACKTVPRFLNVGAEDQMQVLFMQQVLYCLSPQLPLSPPPALFLETVSLAVTQAGLTLASRLLPPLSRCWEYWCALEVCPTLATLTLYVTL